MHAFGSSVHCHDRGAEGRESVIRNVLRVEFERNMTGLEEEKLKVVLAEIVIRA